jgi:hypothetical protein
MTVSNATVTAERRELPQAYGVLTYRFEWTNFAAVDGDRLRVGDAVDGLFLDDASSLIVSWPEGYRLGETTPEPSEVRERSVVWNGPVDFSAGQPRISVAPAGPLSGVPTAGVAALFGALVVAGAAVAYRRRDAEPAAPAGGGDAETEATGDAPADGSGAATAAAASDSTAEPTAGDDDGDASEPDSDEPRPVDGDLLSNEEQVLRLIESEGGRMKQKQVAERLDWTAAKTSQVVTGLRDEGDLDGFRLGRENVLSLPDYDPEGDAGGVDEDGGNRGEGEDAGGEGDATGD